MAGPYTRIKLRRATSAEWTAGNKILSDGEFGYEKVTRKFKIGDGTTAWNSLPYATQGQQGDPGPGIITGGTTGQALVKASNTDYDTVWGDVVSDPTIQAIAANTTLAAAKGELTAIVTTGAIDRTVTLPAAAANPGRKINVKKIDAGVGKVIVDGAAAETIDGDLTTEVITQYAFVTVQSDGSNWIIIA